MRRLTGFWLAIPVFLVGLALVSFLVSHALIDVFSERIETLEHLNKIIKEEKRWLNIQDQVNIDIEFGAESSKFLDKNLVKGMTEATDKKHFIVYLKKPTRKCVVRHELAHVHIALTLDWYDNDKFGQRVFHEILAYSYEITGADLTSLEVW